MAAGNLVVEQVDATAPEAVELMAALDLELSARYPGDQIRGIDAGNFRAAGGVFLIGRREGLAVACGALRPFSGSMKDRAVELKRMYVRDGHRGQGFARTILNALEEIAKQRGYETVRLETGDQQPEAISLYESAGYRSIPCEGMDSDERSRCFEKIL
ncbi:MAG TPA: GNAT family N-acetyltransferase [Bryobacteraceae bacterium]|nr:GNAT family N-acetyltransferase [Bryobacteraceae bacterium]